MNLNLIFCHWISLNRRNLCLSSVLLDCAIASIGGFFLFFSIFSFYINSIIIYNIIEMHIMHCNRNRQHNLWLDQSKWILRFILFDKCHLRLPNFHQHNTLIWFDDSSADCCCCFIKRRTKRYGDIRINQHKHNRSITFSESVC